MNILIISYYFYPNNRIASFRIDAFAKYFRQAGHNVTVVALADKDESCQWNGCEVHYIKDPVISDVELQNLIINRRYPIRRIIKGLEIRLYKEPMLWGLKVKAKVNKLFRQQSFDVVLSSYSPMTAHRIVLSLKEKYKFFWIADIRDEMSTHPYISKRAARLLKPFEKAVLQKADLVVSVSKPIIEDLKNICRHDRYLEIKNGYDYAEYHGVNFQPRFTMAYIGNFYEFITPHKWFKAFAELIKENRIPADSIIKIIGSIKYYEEPPELRDNVIRIPKVAHEEAIRMSTTETDVLVMMHPSGRKGVYSGKVFDYLASNKPILALYDPNDVVGELIAETKAGFVVDESDHEGIKDAIIKCYEIWKNQEVLPRDWNKIKQYTRRNQTQILLNYMEAVSNRHNTQPTDYRQ